MFWHTRVCVTLENRDSYSDMIQNSICLGCVSFRNVKEMPQSRNTLILGKKTHLTLPFNGQAQHFLLGENKEGVEQ